MKPEDLDRLIVITHNVQDKDHIRLFKRGEQYIYTSIVQEMVGCGSCPGSVPVPMDFYVICVNGRDLKLDANFAEKTRDRHFEPIDAALQRRAMPGLPEGVAAYDDTMLTPNNYNPDEELLRFNRMGTMDRRRSPQ